MFLDFGLGIIWTIILCGLFDIKLTLFILFISIVFSVLPDFDFSVELLLHRKMPGKTGGFHRTYTHYPILYLPIVLVIYIIFGKFWALLLLTNVYTHFIHDSLWLGFGIKWFWPFSLNNFKFFANPKDGGWSSRLVASWSPDQLVKVMNEYGDDDWFKKMYLSLSKPLLIEFFGFVLALIILAIYTFRI